MVADDSVVIEPPKEVAEMLSATLAEANINYTERSVHALGGDAELTKIIVAAGAQPATKVVDAGDDRAALFPLGRGRSRRLGVSSDH